MCRFLSFAVLFVVVGTIGGLPALADETTPVAMGSIRSDAPERAPVALDRLLSPERKALWQIQEEGRLRVRDLARRYRALPPGKERLQLEKEIVQLKRGYENRFLDTRETLERETLLMPQASGFWVADGIPVCTDPSSQDYSQAAADGAGGVFVAWVDERGLDQIYVQRITEDGAVHPSWPPNGIPVTPAPPGWQHNPRIASDGAGGALITWAQRDPTFGDWDIYVQRITGSGTVATGWPAAGADVGYAPEDQLFPDVITDGTGGAIVAWLDYRVSAATSIYAGRVSSTGTKLWTSGGEWVTSDVNGPTGAPPEVCGDGQSGVYLAWESVRVSSLSDIYVQRLDSNGDVPTGWPSGGENFVPTANLQITPDLIPDGVGGAILSWSDDRSITDFDIYATRISAASSIVPGWNPTGVPVSTQSGSDQVSPRLVPDGNGGALLAWSDSRHANSNIFCSKVTSTGSVVWAPGNNGMRLCFSTVNQQGYRVCSDGEGGLIVVWEENRGADLDIYAQHITAGGEYAYSLMGAPVCTATGMQWQSSIAHVATQGAIVVFTDWRDGATNNGDIYAQYIDGFCNLAATSSLAGWHSPLVPRNAPDATLGSCVVSPTLNGNASTTYINYVFDHQGPFPTGEFDAELWVDDNQYLGGYGFLDNSPPAFYYTLNAGPSMIRGGRHTLHHIVDVDGEVPESDEVDNVYSEQYVWSPLVVQKHVPVLRDPPPVRGIFLLPNCDGFEFTRPSDVAWVTAIAPLDVLDDYDLFIFDDYSGSTSGFSNLLAGSGVPNGSTDFVVGHYSGTPLTVYPGVVEFDSPSDQLFVADQSDATGRQGGAIAEFPHQLFEFNRLVDVYEANLTAGVTYYFTLLRHLGQSDIALEVFRGLPGDVVGRGGSTGGTATVVSADIDTLAYTPSVSGYHPVVVYRERGTDVGTTEVLYTLKWGSVPAVVDVPEGDAPRYQLAFHGITPNPMMESGRLNFTLAERAEVRLTVYDIRGRRASRLLKETMEPGPHVVGWDGRGIDGRRLGAGIYWIRLETAGRIITKRAVLLN